MLAYPVLAASGRGEIMMLGTSVNLVNMLEYVRGRECPALQSLEYQLYLAKKPYSS